MSHTKRQKGSHECLNPKCSAWWWCANPDCDGLDRLFYHCRQQDRKSNTPAPAKEA